MWRKVYHNRRDMDRTQKLPNLRQGENRLGLFSPRPHHECATRASRDSGYFFVNFATKPPPAARRNVTLSPALKDFASLT